MTLPLAEAGRYAGYVNAAYGISGLVLGVIVVEALARSQRWKRRARRASEEKPPSHKRS